MPAFNVFLLRAVVGKVSPKQTALEAGMTGWVEFTFVAISHKSMRAFSSFSLRAAVVA